MSVEKYHKVVVNMEKLGDKLTEQALISTNSKITIQLVKAAESAYKAMCSAMEKTTADYSDVTFIFSSSVTKVTLRSDVWRAYTDFINCLGFNGLKKGDFFSYLLAHGFKVATKTDGYFLIPPGQTDQRRKGYADFKVLEKQISQS